MRAGSYLESCRCCHWSWERPPHLLALPDGAAVEPGIRRGRKRARLSAAALWVIFPTLPPPPPAACRPRFMRRIRVLETENRTEQNTSTHRNKGHAGPELLILAPIILGTVGGGGFWCTGGKSKQLNAIQSHISWNGMDAHCKRSHNKTFYNFYRCPRVGF